MVGFLRTLSNWRYKGHGPGYVKLGPGHQAHVRYPVSEVLLYEELTNATRGESLRDLEMLAWRLQRIRKVLAKQRRQAPRDERKYPCGRCFFAGP
jgi:hypothetical protein